MRRHDGLFCRIYMKREGFFVPTTSNQPYPIPDSKKFSKIVVSRCEHTQPASFVVKV
ncbi:hypothetical protein CEXT_559841, partial [Caerostris extrusa]